MQRSPVSPILTWMQALAFHKENKTLKSAYSSCTRTLHPWQSQAERFSCLEALSWGLVASFFITCGNQQVFFMHYILI